MVALVLQRLSSQSGWWALCHFLSMLQGPLLLFYPKGTTKTKWLIACFPHSLLEHPLTGSVCLDLYCQKKQSGSFVQVSRAVSASLVRQ